MSDPIVDEVRAVRDAVAREYGYDMEKLADALREHKEKSSRTVGTPGFPEGAVQERHAAGGLCARP